MYFICVGDAFILSSNNSMLLIVFILLFTCSKFIINYSDTVSFLIKEAFLI